MPDLAFGEGVLYFPVTPFDAQDRVDTGLFAELVSDALGHGPAGVFAACGTGEFHALAPGEFEAVVASAVEVTAGVVPVVAGTGGSVATARALAAAAERSGADALLVLPPYLVQGSQAGLLAYIRAIADATRLPLIVYHRGTARLTVDTVRRLLDEPRVIGFKDGVGDVATMQEFVLAAEKAGRADTLFFNGLLTAEMSQLAYAGAGVPLYSSAVFAMAPEIANAFYRAYRADDTAVLRSLLAGFYGPLVALRDETPGFAVSLIKAGLRIAGRPVGSVRPPLTDPDPAQLRTLEELLRTGHRLAAAQ